MKLSSTFVLSALLLSVAANPLARADQKNSRLLINPASFSSLPTKNDVNSLNSKDIQGDILIGMRKKKELFFFFSIDTATDFKTKLKSDVVPLLTSTSDLLDNSTQPITAMNIAFSQTGLQALGVNDTLGDADFQEGQFKNAQQNFNDKPENWVGAFKSNNVHGVVLLASDTQDNIDKQLEALKSNFTGAMTELYKIQGAARPGDEEGHEHFGFMDGISQPHVDGFGEANPGQATVPAGHILVGENGDGPNRPDWAKDGSFLAFRQLQQFVPEFDKFLADNPVSKPGLTPEQGSELLGARMVGRWKSGAPIELSPDKDDPALATNKAQNNNFDFANDTTGVQCPFSAHIRKTNPRNDVEGFAQPFHIVRAGIPYGPEVTPPEKDSKKSDPAGSPNERGLAFVAYQSNITAAFKFLQQTWANNAAFRNPGVGFDPIIGTAGGGPRNVSGLNEGNLQANTSIMTDFVVSRGGEYFFSPSISAIRDKLTA